MNSLVRFGAVSGPKVSVRSGPCNGRLLELPGSPERGRRNPYALLRLLAASAGPPALEAPKLARRMFRKDQHMQQIAKLLPPLPEP